MNSVSKKIIIISGREKIVKDDEFNKRFLAQIKADNYHIVFDPRFGIEAKLHVFKNKYKRVPPIVFKAFRFLLYSKYYCKCPGDVLKCIGQYIKKRSYFEFKYMLKSITLSYVLKKYNKNQVVILCRSAGGVFASRIAGNFNIKLIICIGYPFKHPEKSDEPFRYEHLKSIKTPTLIVQGVNDVYGGIEVKTKYQLSDYVELFFVDANHEFRIEDETWDKLMMKTKQALSQAFILLPNSDNYA